MMASAAGSLGYQEYDHLWAQCISGVVHVFYAILYEVSRWGLQQL